MSRTQPVERGLHGLTCVHSEYRKEVVMTLAQANIEIRERLRTRRRSDKTLLPYRARRPREDYPPYIKTDSDHDPVPTEEDTNNKPSTGQRGG